MILNTQNDRSETTTTQHRDFFKSIKQEENFVGSLYDLNYNNAKVLVNDYDKNKVKGLPHGCLLMALYNNELRANELEGILLRVVGTADIPQTQEITQSLTDMCVSKKIDRENIAIDVHTKHFFQFSGLFCRALGTFYENDGQLCFGTDIESFLGAHNYKVYKPQKEQLQIIINGDIQSPMNHDAKDSQTEARQQIGTLQYTSSRSYDKAGDYTADFFLKLDDLLARKSAFFGMTRTGKSNTIKIIITAIENLSSKRAEGEKVGQIIFDINGEYTFPNKQDSTCIYDVLQQNALRFSTSVRKTQEYDDVRAIQYDFYNDETLEDSFALLCDEIRASARNSDYINYFTNINMCNPFEIGCDEFENQRRKIALYKCVLYRARFKHDDNCELKFKDFEGEYVELHIEQACTYFEYVNPSDYGKDRDYEALLTMLGNRNIGYKNNMSGFKFLAAFNHLHALGSDQDYKQAIDCALRKGKVVLVDLSSAPTYTQQKYIDRLCTYIFQNSIDRFTKDEHSESIQMYFEEAHNIFPKDDRDLNNIYNRLAKEGAKLNIGISYSTQEVSSIATSILKNTQNWFISHLNNQDEIRVLEKYYDFADFSHNIMKNSDVGFSRIKTYSNNFIVPIKINQFNKESHGISQRKSGKK